MNTPVRTSPKSIDALPDQTQRADLACRREVKYTFHDNDPSCIRSLLKGNCRQLVYHRPVSQVYSIYFDSSSLEACYANLDGLALREKLRIRWYDTPLACGPLFVELKWRNNRLTGKHRFAMRCSAPLSSWTFDGLRSEIASQLPPTILQAFLKYDQPQLLVHYRREHFQSPDGDRLTLDHDLVFYDQSHRIRPTVKFGVPLEDLIVLEGKTRPGSESRMSRWLEPKIPRATRCSKYVLGCRQLGFIHPSLI